MDDPDTINDSTSTSQLPAIEQKLRNPLAAKRAVKGMRRTVAGHTALHLAARAHAPPEVALGSPGSALEAVGIDLTAVPFTLALTPTFAVTPPVRYSPRNGMYCSASTPASAP